jgi:hypothetical protein
LAWAYLTAGKLDEARRELEAVLEHSIPMAGIYGQAASHYFLGVTFLKMGMAERARSEAEKLRQMAEARENAAFLAWHDDLLARIGGGQMSNTERERVRVKGPRFYMHGWFGWMADIPGGIPLE